MTKDNLDMEKLLQEQEESFKTLETGDNVEGTIISVAKNGIWMDLGPYGVGLVVGPELRDKSIVGALQPGEKISASILELETEDGHPLLSLKKASKEKIWESFKRLRDEKKLVVVKPFDSNKGGLLIEYEGVRGFLPVSQLSTENYPRVADKDEIQIRLSGLINKPLEVVILDTDEKEGKLIFSEKEAKKGEVNQVLDKFEIGAKVKGVVTGVVDYGIFVNVEGVEGLIHISEISWERVEDPSKVVKIGDEVEASIIGIDKDRFSLSMKRLTDDPWAEAAKVFNVGDVVSGEVTRITPFGAFVRIHDKIEALVHISELSEGHIKEPGEVVELAKKYNFRILSIDKGNHKIALSLKALAEKKDENKPARSEEHSVGGVKADSEEETAQKAEKPKKKTTKSDK